LACPAFPAVEVDGNRQHLRQVIHNLLDNALKFTPEGGRVSVWLEPDVDRSGEVKLTVEDTGPGIPAEDLPFVFDRFFRSGGKRQTSGEARGSGLGLSICRSVVRAHDGTIHVESAVGKGSRFVVRLPLARGTEGKSSDSSLPGRSTSVLAAVWGGPPDPGRESRSGQEPTT
jgi:signal transduction histidine kinase